MNIAITPEIINHGRYVTTIEVQRDLFELYDYNSDLYILKVKAGIRELIVEKVAPYVASKIFQNVLF
jgi:hypothetical protein